MTLFCGPNSVTISGKHCTVTQFHVIKKLAQKHTGHPVCICDMWCLFLQCEMSLTKASKHHSTSLDEIYFMGSLNNERLDKLLHNAPYLFSAFLYHCMLSELLRVNPKKEDKMALV